MAGFEPTASKSQTSRATSCATPRLVKIFNFSVKSVSGQTCGQKFFAEEHGGEKARKCEENGDFASFRRSAHEAVTRSQTSRATSCATPRGEIVRRLCLRVDLCSIPAAPGGDAEMPGRSGGFVDKKHRSAASRVCPAGDSRLRPVFRKPVRSWLSPEPCGAFFFFWGEIWDSNPRPSGPQPDALTNCANPTIFFWRALGDSNPRPTA